ncbi:MAG: hypothetical protein EBT02_12210 [Planctomycetia bacterium]|nr:hypothetical protein [Planctomycetia bacterium]
MYTILVDKACFFNFLIIFDTFICQSSIINLFSKILLILLLFLRGKVVFKVCDYFLIFCDLFWVTMRSS